MNSQSRPILLLAWSVNKKNLTSVLEGEDTDIAEALRNF